MIRDPGSCVINRNIYERTRHFRHSAPPRTHLRFIRELTTTIFSAAYVYFLFTASDVKMVFYSATVNSIQEF